MMDIESIKEKILEKDIVKKVFVIILGVYLLALNYNLFLLPNNYVIGGTSGLSIIVKEIFGWNPTVFLYITSIILVVVSYIILGKKETRITIVGSLFYPLMISLTEPIANFFRPYFQFDNVLLLVIVTAIIHGIANGLIYKVGFNTGGSDILMRIINKYFHIPEGKSVLILNAVIILLGGFVFGLNQIIYAIIILIIYTKIVDAMLIGISNSKMFFIYTKEHKKVKDYIIKEMQTGVTLVETEGGYSKKKDYMLMCVVQTKDYYLFKEMVLAIDPNAFLVINDCYEVHGGHRRNLPFI